MAKTKVSEWSATPADNTDIDSINIAEGCAPSGINNAIREVMAQVKDFQAGTYGDPFNGPIGSGTPAAGAFTTLSASGAVTLSGGTANGVAYLNGSKVLTTGSALTFDGTNIRLNDNQTNTIPALTQGIYLGSTTNDAVVGYSLRVQDGVNNRRGSMFLDDANGVWGWDVTASTGVPEYVWRQAGSEQMRLTSTGLGIGTSSPAGRLDVATSNTNDDGIYLTADGSSFGYASNITFRSKLTTGGSIGVAAKIRAELSSSNNAGLLFFTTASGTNAEKMRLDSSGNLGLGVTPSAWTAGGKNIEVGSAGNIIQGQASQLAVIQNATFNSGWKYSANGLASFYNQTAGTHVWFNAPSGTAGNAISFTQAMTLTATGEFLLGMTSASTNVPGTLIARLSANVGAIRNVKTATGTYESLQNYHNGSYVGGITYSDTATALVTSSDYRLKNITGPITTSGAYIDSLNPVEGTWKADGSVFVGLIAHEVQEVSKTFVTTGTKDGEKMQGMTYSSPEMIANLIAEVKSLRQRVATLEAQ